ncbi:hypothetical protein GO599_05025 [Sulfolobus islandicus]|uniref:Uncharacterized protein n=1 Tax=Saccharolobus islandicus (strain HVE10/4) TaxID=930943 RepID=F0NN66_SACI0|nr:hypothetical protein [Sulfolobus islandicus]ADX81749.1 conserved hypothetical protein [Sulfolobus islandicus HVE10/4]WCM36890.1 hypothetical protein GO599_05025 [Sulfolobus islandicus]
MGPLTLLYKSNTSLIITTSGLSFALKEGIDVNKALDEGVKVLVYSHKFQPLEGLSVEETEAVLLAKDLNYYLITAADKIKEFAEKEGVKVIVL